MPIRARVPISRLFFYFTVNEYMKNDHKAYLLGEMAKMKMPIDIVVQGRQDWICPVENAREMHQHCPHRRACMSSSIAATSWSGPSW